MSEVCKKVASQCRDVILYIYRIKKVSTVLLLLSLYLVNSPIALSQASTFPILQPISSKNIGPITCLKKNTLQISGTTKYNKYLKQKYRPNDYDFKLQKLIVPSSLLILGALGIKGNRLCKLNTTIRNSMLIYDKKECHADDYIQYVPVALYLGLDFTGIKAKHDFKERVMVAATSYAVCTILVNSLKYSVKESRPSGKRNAFPSGHTSTAFTGAELVRVEYGMGCGILAYAMASSVGFLRLYNDKHWLNDIIAGAGVGILSARIGYWLLPLQRKLIGSKSQMCIVPSLNYKNQNYGCSIVLRGIN